MYKEATSKIVRGISIWPANDIYNDTKNQKHKAVAEDSPPSYEASAPNRHKQRQPGPATSGEWFSKDPQHVTVQFAYCHDPSTAYTRQDWVAVLLVKCPNVPALMSDGFSWDSANVVDEDGYFDEGFTRILGATG